MRLLVIEDDAALATGLRRGLLDAGFAVDVASQLAEADALQRINAYDVLLLDLGLPDGDGRAYLAALRAHGIATPVLILTASGTVADRVDGLNTGADDYLPKPFAFQELVARIHALLRRPATAIPPVLAVGDLQCDLGKAEVRCRGRVLELTTKERALLAYLARHRGQLVTRSMLLDHCWDESYDGLSNLVDVHVGRLRRKLESADAGCAIRTVRGAGFVLEQVDR